MARGLWITVGKKDVKKVGNARRNMSRAFHKKGGPRLKFQRHGCETEVAQGVGNRRIKKTGARRKKEAGV